MVRPAPALVFAVSVAALAAPGCGEVEEGETETVRSELGSFGSWSSMGGQVLDVPAIAKTAGTTLTAFGLGTDFHVWTTAQNASGQWTGNWTPVRLGAFPGRPAAVGIDVSSGPLLNHFLIAADGGDGMYWVRIQNQSGSSVPLDWTAIDMRPPPGGGLGFTFSGPPALAFAPASPSTDSVPALFLAGRAAEWNGSIGILANKLTNNNYAHSGWFMVGQPVLAADTAPTLTFVPPLVKGSSYVVLSAGVGSGSNISYRISRFFGFGSSGQPWSQWQSVPNGQFASAPALGATNQGAFQSQTALFGRGTDLRVWYTTALPNGSFAPLGTVSWPQGPLAMGFGNTIVVSEMASGGFPYTNSAVNSLF